MKLIIINGPCGVGKSTAALEIQKELSLSLLIDVDALRATIGGYRDNREDSLKLSYMHAVVLAASHLEAGYSVIIEKAVFKDDWFLDALKTLAEKRAVEFYELLLTASRGAVVERAEKRGFRPGGMLTPERVGEFWDYSQVFLARRPEVTVVDTTNQSTQETVAKIRETVFV